RTLADLTHGGRRPQHPAPRRLRVSLRTASTHSRHKRSTRNRAPLFNLRSHAVYQRHPRRNQTRSGRTATSKECSARNRRIVNTDPIFTAIEQLRLLTGDGPATRKVVDALFRHVHNLKANAAANGLNDLAAAAHEFENVLHSIRTGAADTFVSEAIPRDVWTSLRPDQRSTLARSIAEGAKLFLVEASFDVAHFDREFQNLEQTLSKTGEVISRLPVATPGKVNFRILYAQRDEADPPDIADIKIQEISAALTSPANATHDLEAIERAFEKLS